MLKFFYGLMNVIHYFIELGKHLRHIKQLFNHKFRVKGLNRIVASLVCRNGLVPSHHAGVDVCIDHLHKSDVMLVVRNKYALFSSLATIAESYCSC